MSTQQNRQRIIELIEFAAQEGVTLPYAPDYIAAIEADGGMVDLQTGEIIRGSNEWLVEPTVIGQATAVVLDAEEERTS